MSRISEAFATALRSGREDFNARFAQARHRRPALSGEAFTEFLMDCADPVVRAVDAIAPDRTADTVQAAYDTGLELVSQNLAGPRARHEFIAHVWQGLLTVAAALVAAAPRRMLGAVSNAVCTLAATPGVRPDWWQNEMARLVPRLPAPDDVETFLRVGQVVAWRAGMAHYRAGALAALDTLPEPMARTALGLPEKGAGHTKRWADLRQHLQDDPWYVPEGGNGGGNPTASGVSRTGGFRGFGGLFTEPPRLAVAGGGGFLVHSGNENWLLTADAFGATFHRATAEEWAAADQPSLLPDGVSFVKAGVKLRHGTVPIPFCGQITSRAADASTLAVTGTLTHAVLLVPLHQPAPAE